MAHNLQLDKQPIRHVYCLSLAFGFYLFTLLSCNAAIADSRAGRFTLIDEFLGEELVYEIGFWLFPHCGEATVRLVRAEEPGVYQAAAEGRSVGIVDLMMGRYRYYYTSYSKLAGDGSRLQPLRFEHVTRQLGKETRRTVVFDYGRMEIVFSDGEAHREGKERKVPMEDGVVYEDYLTLFYNFRYGAYGSLERGKTYHLPLQIHEGMEWLDLTIVSRQEEERRRRKEIKKAGKEYFLRFRVVKEDVSSTTGDIQGWLSHEGVPVKGIIKDVIFFGDLWSVLVERKVRGVQKPWR